MEVTILLLLLCQAPNFGWPHLLEYGVVLTAWPVSHWRTKGRVWGPPGSSELFPWSPPELAAFGRCSRRTAFAFLRGLSTNAALLICINIACGDCFPFPSPRVIVVVIARLVLSEKYSMILDFNREWVDSIVGRILDFSLFVSLSMIAWLHVWLAQRTVSLLSRQGKVCQLASHGLSSRTESQRKGMLTAPLCLLGRSTSPNVRIWRPDVRT